MYMSLEMSKSKRGHLKIIVDHLLAVVKFCDKKYAKRMSIRDRLVKHFLSQKLLCFSILTVQGNFFQLGLH